MTNAEKLAKDGNKLALILYTYCQVGDCKGCVFEKDCPEMKCDRINFDWKEWLKQSNDN